MAIYVDVIVNTKACKVSFTRECTIEKTDTGYARYKVVCRDIRTFEDTVFRPSKFYIDRFDRSVRYFGDYNKAKEYAISLCEEFVKEMTNAIGGDMKVYRIYWGGLSERG